MPGLVFEYGTGGCAWFVAAVLTPLYAFATTHPVPAAALAAVAVTLTVIASRVRRTEENPS